MKKINPKGFLLIALFLVFSSSSLFATVHKVDLNAVNGLKDGTSWPNAFVDLQNALSAAASGDQIWIATGTYYPTDQWSGNRSAAFQTISGVSIYGGYDAATNTLNPALYPVFLSGDIGNQGDSSDNSYHVIYNPGSAYGATLYGLNIEDGNADQTTSPNNGGGGMYNVSCSPLIIFCNFKNNNGSQNGGAVANFYCSPQFYSVTFENNKSSKDGGGMYNYTSSPVLNGCLFANNTASGTGGGMTNLASSAPSLVQVTFDKNEATSPSGGGGGISNAASSPTISFCTFTENIGGGMSDLNGCSTQLSSSTFTDNVSAMYGGGYLVGLSSPMISACTFTSNSTTLYGGGLCYLPGSTVYIEYCTFSGNTAQSGGGIAVLSNSGIITGCHVYNNTSTLVSSTSGGGGIYLSDCDDIDLIKATVYENTSASYGGGILLLSSDNINIENSTIHNNDGQLGGGLCINNPSSTHQGHSILNNLLYENTAGVGGGIAFLGSSPDSTEINSNTVTYNTGAYTGDGMFSQYSASTSCTFKNNIIYYNGTYDVDPTLSVGGTYPGFSYCDIGGCLGVNTNIDANPQFVNDTIDDYRISDSLNSPCIEAGDNSATQTDYDNKGDTRIFSANIDMGAYEYEHLTTVYRLAGSNSDESNTEITYNVYPNPAVDHINIVLDQLPEDATIEMKLMDVSGKVVREISETGSASHSINHNVSDLSKGVYFIDILVNGYKRFNSKIVITQ